MNFILFEGSRLYTRNPELTSEIIVAEGHAIVPEAVEQMRADSFVMETNIHYPTESSLIRDSLRKIMDTATRRVLLGESVPNNLQTLGRLLIAKDSPESEAALSRRKAA